jgi:hypothetical protein
MRHGVKDAIAASMEEFQPRVGPVFLGGTCNGSKWRDQVTPMLNLKAFNPVVENWSMETQQIEEQAKREAIASLFVITPKQTGLYAAAELTKAAITEPERTVVAFLEEDEGDTWSEHQKASNQAILDLVKDAGATVANNLEEAAAKVNEIGQGNPVVP